MKSAYIPIKLNYPSHLFSHTSFLKSFDILAAIQTNLDVILYESNIPSCLKNTLLDLINISRAILQCQFHNQHLDKLQNEIYCCICKLERDMPACMVMVF